MIVRKRCAVTDVVPTDLRIESAGVHIPQKLNDPLAACLAVVIIFFVYLFTIGRRVTRLQGEIVRLKSQ
jgi:hypothetical protein